MAKAKKEKMEANPFKLKKELPHLPGYIIVILWTAFIFCMIGWIILHLCLLQRKSSRVACLRADCILKTTLSTFYE